MRRVVVALAGLALTIPLVAARADADIYWSTDTRPGTATIGKADETSTASPIPVTQLYTGLQSAQAMTVDDTYVYWAGPNEIWRAPLAGGPEPQAAFIVGIFNPTALAVDRTHQVIYFTDQNAGRIGKAPLTQGTKDLTYFSTLGVPTGLAVDYSYGYLYWAQNANRWIGRVPLAGGTPNLDYLNAGQGVYGAHGITVDATYLYWANGPTTIGRAPLDGSTAPVSSFIVGANVGPRSTDPDYTPTGIAVDASYVYWGNHAAYTIGRAPVTGGGSATVQNSFIYTLLDPTGVALHPATLTPGPLPPPSTVTLSSLAAGVRLLGLTGGIERSLLAKLAAGQKALDSGNPAAACHSLDAYSHQVDAQSGKHIDTASAAGLTALAASVSRALGCQAD